MMTFFSRISLKDEEGNTFSHQTKTIVINDDAQSIDQARKYADVLLLKMPNAVKASIRYFYNKWEDAIG